MFRRILIAHDGSPAAPIVLQQAFDLGRSEHVESVTVLSVLPPVHLLVGLAGQPSAPLHEQMRDELERGLRAAAVAAPEGLTVRTQLEQGHPGPAIVQAAAEGGYDLIVMGSRSRGRLGAALLGSVSTHVVEHADAAVLVLHPARHVGDEPDVAASSAADTSTAHQQATRA